MAENFIGDFRIEHLFGSKTRARLLSLFLEAPDRAFYVRELTRRIDAQLNSVRRELKNLVDLKLVLEVEGKIIPTERDDVSEAEGMRSEKKKYYQANAAFPLFEDLRNLMKKASILMNNRLASELKERGGVDLVLLTGRFAEEPSIATDVLIVGGIDPRELHEVIARFEGDVGREVNYTFMPREEFLYRREVGDRFLTSILQGKHIVLLNVLAKGL